MVKPYRQLCSLSIAQKFLNGFNAFEMVITVMKFEVCLKLMDIWHENLTEEKCIKLKKFSIGYAIYFQSFWNIYVYNLEFLAKHFKKSSYEKKQTQFKHQSDNTLLRDYLIINRDIRDYFNLFFAKLIHILYLWG